MQDVGAPSNNAAGQGLAPVQTGVHTDGMHWSQEIVYPSDVTFTFGAGEAASEEFLQYTLSNISPEIFGLLVTFQTYQFNNFKVVFANDRVMRDTDDDDAGEAETFACAPYNRVFEVAASTNQQGLLSTLPGSTWTFCNSNSTRDSTDNQRFITQGVTPQYAMRANNQGYNYSNRPLPIYGPGGLDTTVWR